MNSWAERIEAAIATESLTFHCQPIVDIKTHPIAHEVLVRLQEPDGLIPAAEFIAAATPEQMGTIDRLAAIATLKLLQTSETIHAINLSGSTLNDLRFPAFLSEQLDKSAIDPRLLWIEVTEQIILTPPSVQVILALRDLRLLVGLDDFGVGAATIPAVLSIEPDFLKVDGAIVRQILRSHLHECVVVAAMAGAERRGVPLILEHVEGGAIESRILALAQGFPGLRLLLQGYLYGKPEPC